MDLPTALDEILGDYFDLTNHTLPTTSLCMDFRPFADYRLAPNVLETHVDVVGVSTEKTASLAMTAAIENCPEDGRGRCVHLEDDDPDHTTLQVMAKHSHFNITERPL